MILCFALGIANIFHFNLIIIFSVICLYVTQVLPITNHKLIKRLYPIITASAPSSSSS